MAAVVTPCCTGQRALENAIHARMMLEEQLLKYQADMNALVRSDDQGAAADGPTLAVPHRAPSAPSWSRPRRSSRPPPQARTRSTGRAARGPLSARADEAERIRTEAQGEAQALRGRGARVAHCMRASALNAPPQRIWLSWRKIS
jgi:hypothetical protein